MFSEKHLKDEKITLVNDETIVTDETKIAEIFNSYFGNIVEKLNIQPYSNVSITEIGESEFYVNNAIKKYKKHPSILKIKNSIDQGCIFSFHYITLKNIEKEIRNLDLSKAQQFSDIPTRIVKENEDLFSEFLTANFNIGLDNFDFPSILKNADVKPVFKKGCRTAKENYRPISILSNLSKVYERCMFNQIYLYFEPIFSKYQCGFRKGIGAQHCLTVMVENWKKCLDKNGVCGALLTDLSKAFDCLPHDLLIAKLHAYGFDMQSLKFMSAYLINRKQRVKINNSYSSWATVKTGVPQGSILGPLLFNIFLCDIFLFIPNLDIASYADDNTLYSANQTVTDVLSDLQGASTILLKWFKDNEMKANPEKFHLLLSETEKFDTKICDKIISNSYSEKLLGVKIDNKLKFEEHVENLCKKASQKLNALARLSSFMRFEQRKIIMNAFITSQFSYCPTVWMFHSRKLNNRINRIHERALRIIYQDHKSSFSDLLLKDNSLTIHQRNLHSLVTEMFKIKLGIAPKIMNDIFEFADQPYNLRNDFKIRTGNVNTVTYGTETVSFIGPRIWNTLPNECKNASSLKEFKEKIKSWVPRNCPCRICKTYIPQVGFI